MECAIMASIRHSTDSDLSLLWDEIADKTRKDPTLSTLLELIQHGFHEQHPTNPLLKPYWRFRRGLYELDGAILYNDRVVIPPSLRRQVVDTFHAAHQGYPSWEHELKTLYFGQE